MIPLSMISDFRLPIADFSIWQSAIENWQ